MSLKATLRCLWNEGAYPVCLTLLVKAIIMGANGTATYASRGNFLPYFVTTEAEVFRRHDISDLRWHQEEHRALVGV